MTNPVRWLRSHPEFAADAVVVTGCMVYVLILLAIDWLARGPL